MDIFTPNKRSEIMSRIHGKHTGLEVTLRKLLRANSITKFSLYCKLPGSPDISFSAAKVAVYVNGCFCPRLRPLPSQPSEDQGEILVRKNPGQQGAEPAAKKEDPADGMDGDPHLEKPHP